MTNEARLKLGKRLQGEEGFRQFPYLDSLGILTIGYGRNLVSRGISQDEANFLLANDINMVEKQVDSSLPWTRSLDEVRKAVLMDMDFNIGLKSLLQFKKTIQSVKDRRFQEAAIEMLQSKWAKQVGDRAAKLSKAMDTGEWW